MFYLKLNVQSIFIKNINFIKVLEYTIEFHHFHLINLIHKEIMENLKLTDDIFFNQNNLEKSQIVKTVEDTLKGVDDGDIFFEMLNIETLNFDNNLLKSATYNQKSGFGFRGISGEADVFAHSAELTPEAINRASDTVKSVTSNYSGQLSLSSSSIINKPLYINKNPIEETKFADKINLLQKINEA